MKDYSKTYHLLFWILKIGIIFIFFQLPFYKQDLFWLTAATSIVAHIGFFYGNYSFLFVRFFDKRKYVLYSLLIILLSAFHCLFLVWTWNKFSSFDDLVLERTLEGAIGATSIFFSISFTWKLLEMWVQRIKNRLELEKELKNAEYEFLKSQINPHFLFNVLGCINGLALVNSDKTPEAIRNLRELISSASKMKTGKKVSLASELTFLESFIKLHEIRYTVPINLNFEIEDVELYVVEPMLFLPFIENAFKHGELTDIGFVDINCSVESNQLIFTVRNQLIENYESKPGIGNLNVEKRLDYVYPNAYDLIIDTKDNCYSVCLKIDLKDE